MSSRFALGALCVIGTVTIWAGWYVAIRFGLTSTSLDVQDLAALRFGVAGILLLPVVWRRGLASDRLGWTGVAAVALGGGAPFALLVGAGLVYAPVSHASALTQGMVPLAVGLLAAIVLKERLTTAQLVGFALIVAGALTIAGVTVAALASRESIGHAFFVGAALLWAGYTVALRKRISKACTHRRSPPSPRWCSTCPSTWSFAASDCSPLRSATSSFRASTRVS